MPGYQGEVGLQWPQGWTRRWHLWAHVECITLSLRCEVAGLGWSTDWWPLSLAGLFFGSGCVQTPRNYSYKLILQRYYQWHWPPVLAQRIYEHLQNYKQDGRLKFGGRGIFIASQITGDYLGIEPCTKMLTVSKPHFFFCKSYPYHRVFALCREKFLESFHSCSEAQCICFGFISVQVKPKLCWSKRLEVNIKCAWGS